MSVQTIVTRHLVDVELFHRKFKFDLLVALDENVWVPQKSVGVIFWACRRSAPHLMTIQ